eukprot:FR741941.1.p1 GENE.FR741941.1~~FR741941.1.p1  ORF type:complete len:225 (+),score=29.27 FR741941.1:99-677(+)
MVIQFGYATLFSCSFTLAPVLAYVNNYVEIRVDAWKICTQCRRSLPGGAEDIGTWQDIMELMSYLAITTNLLIVIFTASDSSGDGVFSGVTAKYRMMWFLILEHVVIGVKVLLAAIIPDVPDEVLIQLQRQQLIVDKIIFKKNDEFSEIEEYVIENSDGSFKQEVVPPVFADMTIYPTDREFQLKRPPKKVR